MVDSPAPNSDEQFAEWYVWAKREMSTDNRVCLGAAQAAMTAQEGGADLQAARIAARRSVGGHGIGLAEDVSPRRRAYAEWYDWARREIGGGVERQHAATRAALTALDRGADAVEAAAAARREVVPESGPFPGPPMAPGTLAAPPILSPPAMAPMVPPPSVPQAGLPPPAGAPPPIPPPGPALTTAATAPYGPVAAPYPAYPPIPAQAPGHAYAGFWRRFAAFVIDIVLLFVGVFILAFLVSFFVVLGLVSSGQQPTDQSLSGASLVLYGIVFVLVWLYFAGLESSVWQATIGKRLMRLVVTDLYGRRISFGRATGRYFGKILSWLILAAGFWMIPLTQRKQGLHDLIASTLVARREYLSLLTPVSPVQPAQPQNRPGGAGEVQGA